jgi:hypothetical protein
MAQQVQHPADLRLRRGVRLVKGQVNGGLLGHHLIKLVGQASERPLSKPPALTAVAHELRALIGNCLAEELAAAGGEPAGPVPRHQAPGPKLIADRGDHGERQARLTAHRPGRRDIQLADRLQYLPDARLALLQVHGIGDLGEDLPEAMI